MTDIIHGRHADREVDHSQQQTVRPRRRQLSNGLQLNWYVSAAFAVDDRIQVRLAPGTAAAAFELSTLLDGERHVVHVAFDVRRRLKGDTLAANDARDGPADGHLFRRHHSRNLAILSDNDFRPLDVAFDLAIDLQDTAANDLQALSDNPQIIADDRFFWRRRIGGRLWAPGSQSDWSGAARAISARQRSYA